MKISKLHKLIAMLFAIIMSMSVVSCNLLDFDDDDEEYEIDALEALFGTWNFYDLQYTFYRDWTGTITGDMDFDEEDMYSTRSASRAMMTISFTYTFDAIEEVLEMTIDGETERLQVLELNENTMVIVDSYGEQMMFTKEGATAPVNPDILYPPCPLTTLYGNWGVAGQPKWGFNEEGYARWFIGVDELFEPDAYTYDEETGFLNLLGDGSGEMMVFKVTDDIIFVYDYEDREAPFLLTRITDEPFSVGDESLLYDKTWTMVGVSRLDNKPAFPWTYYFDSKGYWSSSVQGMTQGGKGIVFDKEKKTLTLSSYNDEIVYKVECLTNDKIILVQDSGYKTELVVLPE